MIHERCAIRANARRLLPRLGSRTPSHRYWQRWLRKFASFVNSGQILSGDSVHCVLLSERVDSSVPPRPEMLEPKVIFMSLHFTVSSQQPAVAQRFVNLVNGLLPYGWRFTITPLPVARMLFSRGLIPGQAYTVVAGEGTGSLIQTDPFGTLQEGSQAWQRRFREGLNQLIREHRPSRFEIAEHMTNSFFFDSYAHQTIDLPDLERAPPRFAAGALIHALQEGLVRKETVGTRHDFNLAHEVALTGWEARVMGGRRLEAELLTRPRGINTLVPPPSRWDCYEPYLRSDGTVLAAVLRMRGRAVLGGRMDWYPSLDAFRERVPA